MVDKIEFYAAVQKVQTLVDGGIRVTLDLPESAVVQMAELAACKIHETVVDVTCVPRSMGDGNDRTVSRSKAKKRVRQGDSGVQ